MNSWSITSSESESTATTSPKRLVTPSNTTPLTHAPSRDDDVLSLMAA